MLFRNELEIYTPIGHGAATVAVLASWAGVFAPVITFCVTAASLVWFLICIWESETCKHWKNNLVAHHRAKRLMRLQAKGLLIAAKIVATEKLRSDKADARTMVATAAIDAKSLVAAAAADAAVVVAGEPALTAAKLP